MIEALSAWLNRESSAQMIDMIIIILLLLFIADLVALGVYSWIAHKVEKYSSKYDRLLEINRKYKFAEFPDNIEIQRRYSTLQKYRQRDFRQELFYELRDKKKKYETLIEKADGNQRNFLLYCNELDSVKDTEPQTIRGSKVPCRIFLHIEKRLFRKEKFCPETGFSVTISASYTSPAGRNHYEDETSFSYSEIKAAYENMLKRVERENSESERKRMERSKMTPSLRYDVLKRDHFRCQICGASQADGVKLHVDHIVPVSKGGKTELSNLRTLCDMCNLGKSDKIE